jgi:hypothetical protein
MAFLPGPGFAAVPCLLKDTMQLAAFSQNSFPLGHSAMLVNEGLPARLVELARRDGEPHGQDGRRPGNGLQGGVRRPARLAELQAAQPAALETRRVLCTDPYVPDPSARAARARRSRSDVLFLATRTARTAACASRRAASCTTSGTASEAEAEPLEGPRHRLGGFIAGYLVEELLREGHDVVGLDNYSKYGPVEKATRPPRYTFVAGDARDAALLAELVRDCDHFVAGAARIGGISYFHEYAYDLLAETSGSPPRASTPPSPRTARGG